MENYNVEKPLASGSFGQIFLVTHKTEAAKYVLKKISISNLDKKERDGVEQEVTLLQSVRHPNIVAYKDNFFMTDSEMQMPGSNTQVEHLCILMEFCDSGDLYTYLQKSRKNHVMQQGSKEEHLILEWFIQIVCAVQFLHARNILHRDLKTQNIFLTGQVALSFIKAQHQPLSRGVSSLLYGNELRNDVTSNSILSTCVIKLGDFGIAKVLNSTFDLAKTQIGTPYYMSPEVFKNASYSYKSDIWSLGCVLYELVCGKHAFGAQSLNGLAVKVLRGKYTPIPNNCSCSKDLQTLIKSLLSVNPVHRPSMSEILHNPVVRKKIKTAIKHVVSVSSSESERKDVYSIYADQMCSLNLGLLVDRPKNDKDGILKGAVERDMADIREKLEKLRQERSQHEEMLKQLEETKRSLRAATQGDDGFYNCDDGDLNSTSDSNMSGGGGGTGGLGGDNNNQNLMNGLNHNIEVSDEARNYIAMEAEPAFRNERERIIFEKNLCSPGNAGGPQSYMGNNSMQYQQQLQAPGPGGNQVIQDTMYNKSMVGQGAGNFQSQHQNQNQQLNPDRSPQTQLSPIFPGGLPDSANCSYNENMSSSQNLQQHNQIITIYGQNPTGLAGLQQYGQSDAGYMDNNNNFHVDESKTQNQIPLSAAQQQQIQQQAQTMYNQNNILAQNQNEINQLQNDVANITSLSNNKAEIEQLHLRIEACMSAINKSQMTIESLKYRLQERETQIGGQGYFPIQSPGRGPGPGPAIYTQEQPYNQNFMNQQGSNNNMQNLQQQNLNPNIPNTGVGSGSVMMHNNNQQGHHVQNSGQNQMNFISNSPNVLCQPSEAFLFLKTRRDHLHKTCLVELGREKFQKMFTAYRNTPSLETFLSEIDEVDRGFVSLFEQIVHLEQQSVN